MAETTKTKPTEAQIEVLMSDWLGQHRESGTYIHKNTKGTITREMSKNEHFSDYILGDADSIDDVELMRQGRDIAQNVVDGMTDEIIHVALGNNNCTNGKVINLSTDYFDNPELSSGEKLDLLIGFATHEAAHVRYTDFDKKRKWLDKCLEPYMLEIKAQIENILEDERIEHLIGEEMTGLTDYLGCCKKYVFGEFEKDKKLLVVDTNNDPLVSFLNTLIGVVRYPDCVTREQIIDNFDELNAVRALGNGYLKSYNAVMAYADKICDIIKDIIKKKLEQQKQEEQKKKESQSNGLSSQNGQPEESNQSGNSTGGNQKPDSNKGNNQNAQSGNNPSGGNTDAQSGNQQGSTPEITKQELQEAVKKAMSSPNVNRMLQAMEKMSSASKGTYSNTSSKISNENDKKYVNGECEKETTGAGAGNIVYMQKVTGDQSAYNKALKEVKKYVPAMTKALKCRAYDQDYELQGESSGKLNTNKLISLKCGNENIFVKRGSTTCESACICLLIDESGSMKGSKLEEARQAAVLINEAVKHIDKLELFIYGYTNSDMNIYCERKNANKYALGSTRAKGSTPSGQAMEIASNRVRKMTDSKCLMLVLTDGAPDNRFEMTEQDKKVRKKNFIPVGIWIGKGAYEGLMQDYIQLEEFSDLAPKIGKLVKKKLLKTLQKHETD